jgi:ATP-dependent DNA helicase RecQ
MTGASPARLMLPARRSAIRAKPGTEPRRPRTDTSVLAPEALDLFEALRAYRLEVARKEGVPPYVVASDRSLRDIATLRPKSRGELLMAHGIGDTKAERYGDGLLDVVRRADQ